jgi:hypothetical protein
MLSDPSNSIAEGGGGDAMATEAEPTSEEKLSDSEMALSDAEDQADQDRSSAAAMKPPTLVADPEAAVSSTMSDGVMETVSGL